MYIIFNILEISKNYSFLISDLKLAVLSLNYHKTRKRSLFPKFLYKIKHCVLLLCINLGNHYSLFFLCLLFCKNFKYRELLKSLKMQIHENVYYVKLFVSMPLRNIGLHNYRKHRKNACIFSIKVRSDM